MFLHFARWFYGEKITLMTYMDRQHSLTIRLVSMVSRGGFMVKKITLMTYMDRQHSLTIRLVSMVSVMNIHGRRIVRLVRIDAPSSGLSGVR